MIFDDLNSDLESEQLYTLRTLKTPRAGRMLARWLLGLFLVFLLGLFLPWQQNIRGTGKVTALTPANRPQSVESAIAGRIDSWNINEGDYVKKGDTILTLTEIKDKFFDPRLLERMQEQLTAKSSAIDSKGEKNEALLRQIKALKEARNVKMQQARNKLLQSQYKLASDSTDYEAEKIRYANLENQFQRNKSLYEAGNIALTKFQDIESKLQEARMKLVSAENRYLESRTELINSRVNISGTAAEYIDKISKAESDLNANLSSMFESQADISKLRNEYSNTEIRTQFYKVTAPQAGYVVKASKSGIGETIKEGEAIVTILPGSEDLAVALYIQAMDLPLIAIGRKVRLIFDGWPALQFSGWPSVAVGSFGGVVKVIDRVNSSGGEFRILIVPDSDDDPWPSQIRQGSGAKGWVMLDDVPIWYEIWRQLNGFPPSMYENPENMGAYSEEKKK